MQVVTNVALITINETLIVQLVSFLVFLFVINRVMFRPLRHTAAERAFYIDEMKSEIQSAGKKYDKALVDLRKQERHIRSAALALSKEHTDAGNHEAEMILQTTRDEIFQQHARSRAEIAEKLAEARTQIDAESDALAHMILEKILDRRIAS